MAFVRVNILERMGSAPGEMVSLFEWRGGIEWMSRRSAAHRKIIRICPPLCFQMDDVSFFEEAINKSFDSL